MRRRTHKNPDVHSEWLSQVDVDGPFLAHPVIKDIWPSGVDRLGDSDDRLRIFKQSFMQWQRAFDHYVEQPKTPESKAAYDLVRRAWIDVVLDDIAEWADLRADADVTVRSPGEQITVTATGALQGRDGDTAAMLLVCEPTSGLRAAGLDGWAANDVDRLAMLLRKAQVEVGIVTDGQWWALVWAKDGKPTGSGMVNALTWAEEPLLRDAFVTLINQRRFRAADAEQRLPRLFERSELEAEEITEALGTQVRRSVELLVQAFSEARLAAAKVGDPDPLAQKPDDVYQAAVTVMMRIVFLLFAEERDMLPTEQLYWDSYAIKDLLDDLRGQAAGGEEHLDETYDAWHRLLAVSQALHDGANYDEMRMPAYGGSLLDPDRFPWLHATDGRGLRLKVSDRVMLHVLESVQTVVAKGERRRISFREVDVEQIGYIYEGLLGYSCAEVTDDIVLGLVGKDGEEPEIPLVILNELYDHHGGDSKEFAAGLVAWVKHHQPAATGKTAAALAKLVDKEPSGDDRAELVRLLTPVANGNQDLLETLVSWGNLIRRDLRNIPLVIPVGGLVVVETPSRKNAGAHYTPRSLAEEVVLHTLQPLVYEPGPLQTNDGNKWRLKSASAILDLKVADIAAGSGAFLVAAARYLSERLVEAWIAEGMLDESASADADELRRRALREVIARCLYGADINPMAVEMCKLSLWLVSMDKTKPFSFVDDKIFCGNSLLGLTSLDQLRYLHIDTKPSTMQQQLLVDIDAKIATASQLRHELASPVEEHDPMRSTRAKTRLLEQLRNATAELNLIADGVIAAGLPFGGKSGRPLDDAFKTLSWQLQQAFPGDGSPGDPTALLDRTTSGLTPTVETDYERWEPLHWVLEAPDVILERGGFDAVVGNPPFLVGKKISGAFGSNAREWLANQVAGGQVGNSDLVGYFLRRAVSLCHSDGGIVGLVTAKVISEGDTRQVALDPIVSSAGIFRARRNEPWPTGAAATRIAHLWLVQPVERIEVRPTLDGVGVATITASLEAGTRVAGLPARLRANSGHSFKGYDFGDPGFLISEVEAARLLSADERNAEVVLPFVNGKDLMATSSGTGDRYAIFFGEMGSEQAHSYPEVFAVAEQRLVSRQLKADSWWKFHRPRPALTLALRTEVHPIGISAVSRHAVPTFLPLRTVMGSTVVVFTGLGQAGLALLASSVHLSWVLRWGSFMKQDIRYTPTDVFETFPMPESTDDLERLGAELDSSRIEVMRARDIGLTSLYNQIHDSSRTEDPDIDRIRSLHVEIDAAVAASYGWTDLSLEHGFHEYRQMERWTFSPAARAEILDRLLELNHERARAEGQDVPDQNSSNGQDTLFA